MKRDRVVGRGQEGFRRRQNKCYRNKNLKNVLLPDVILWATFIGCYLLGQVRFLLYRFGTLATAVHMRMHHVLTTKQWRSWLMIKGLHNSKALIGPPDGRSETCREHWSRASIHFKYTVTRIRSLLESSRKSEPWRLSKKHVGKVSTNFWIWVVPIGV